MHSINFYTLKYNNNRLKFLLMEYKTIVLLNIGLDLSIYNISKAAYLQTHRCLSAMMCCSTSPGFSQLDQQLNTMSQYLKRKWHCWFCVVQVIGNGFYVILYMNNQCCLSNYIIYYFLIQTVMYCVLQTYLNLLYFLLKETPAPGMLLYRGGLRRNINEYTTDIVVHGLYNYNENIKMKTPKQALNRVITSQKCLT